MDNAVRRGLEALSDVEGPDDWIPPCIHCGTHPSGYQIGPLFRLYCVHCDSRDGELVDAREESSLDELIADWRDDNIDWQP